MIVCIAEKPSVAKDIARIIGATTARDGYMEGNGYQVTWTFGHLCELKEPDDYTPMWKRWSLSALPMIPQRFGIKLINDEGIRKQFNTIERLMQAADSIINCGDAGQEGGFGWMSTFRGGKKSVRIDYIFHDEMLKGLTYYKRELTYSDHYPVFMKIAL